MATILHDIKDLIKTKISGLKSGSDTIFQEVFDYPMGNFTKYPAVVIIPVAQEGDIITTKQNNRTFKFEISMYQENTPEGRTASQAMEAMVTAIDAFILAFDQDKNLNYQVDYIEVVRGSFKFRAQNGPFAFAVFEVDCKVLVQNY
jgi:hypothetical protein